MHCHRECTPVSLRRDRRGTIHPRAAQRWSVGMGKTAADSEICAAPAGSSLQMQPAGRSPWCHLVASQRGSIVAWVQFIRPVHRAGLPAGSHYAEVRREAVTTSRGQRRNGRRLGIMIRQCNGPRCRRFATSGRGGEATARRRSDGRPSLGQQRLRPSNRPGSRGLLCRDRGGRSPYVARRSEGWSRMGKKHPGQGNAPASRRRHVPKLGWVPHTVARRTTARWWRGGTRLGHATAGASSMAFLFQVDAGSSNPRQAAAARRGLGHRRYGQSASLAPTLSYVEIGVGSAHRGAPQRWSVSQGTQGYANATSCTAERVSTSKSQRAVAKRSRVAAGSVVAWGEKPGTVKRPACQRD